MDEPDLDDLTTEGINPDSAHLDRLTSLELVQLMNREDAGVAEAVGREAANIAAAVDAISERMKRGGRLVYIGAGTSGRLAVLDAAECTPTFSAPVGQVVGLIAGGREALTHSVEGAEDCAEGGAGSLEELGLKADDSVVGISASGRAPFVLGALTFACERGALTIALSCNEGSRAAELVDIAITPVVGPEVLAGSTRLKAGTATKMVLNMLSTGAFVRLGKTWGNLMVDLRATNEKLAKRALRIVCRATGLDPEAAQRELDRCGGDVRKVIRTVSGTSFPSE